jgi:predicted DNA-binding transcriptional regulator YafY
MALVKNALLRYLTLDKCFRNFGRQYYFDDLLEAVNSALEADNPNTSGINTRQLRGDISFMRSETGYNAPIETYFEGKKGYYRYADRDFTISGSPLNDTEAEQLKNAIAVLQRFEGAPQFEWVNEVSAVLKDRFSSGDGGVKAMAFDTNIDYTGYEFITVMFNAIVNKQVLKVRYEPFTKEAFTLTFHPYYLKQYNNRWFVFGLNEEEDMPTFNLALDRIAKAEATSGTFIPNNTDWEAYFWDVIGVTRPEGEPCEVELIAASEQVPYIRTKPLHHSQKIKELDDGSLQVRLKLIPNYELQSLLLSFGERVRVVGPEVLKLSMANRLVRAAEQY